MILSISSRVTSSVAIRPTVPAVVQDRNSVSEPTKNFIASTTAEIKPSIVNAKSVADMDTGDRLTHYLSVGDMESAHREGKRLMLETDQQYLEGLKFNLESSRLMHNDWNEERSNILEKLSSSPSDKRDRLTIELNVADAQIIASRSFMDSNEKYLNEALSRLQPQIDELTAWLSKSSEGSFDNESFS